MEPTYITGKARVTGVQATFTLISNITVQSIKLAQEFDEDTIKDENNKDCSWRWDNGRVIGDVNAVLAGPTAALVKAAAVFIAPGSEITVSAGAVVTGLEGSWGVMAAQSIDLANTDVGKYALKLRRYNDAAQQTASVTPAT